MVTKRTRRPWFTLQDYLDAIGKTFNCLLVEGVFSCLSTTKVLYACVCKCGNFYNALPYRLHSGNTGSCGCLQKAAIKKTATKHGKSQTSPLYAQWLTAKSRCFNSKFPKYKNYGKRGISMHEDFKKDFFKYESYLLGLYPNLYGLLEKKLQIDRIDTNGDYTYGNLRVVTVKENCNNRTNNHHVVVFGKKMTIAEASAYSVVSQHTIWKRIMHQKWTDEEAVLLPKLPDHGSTPFKVWRKAAFPNDIAL